MTVKGKRIYVGLSGGVDSAVSAALLHKAGALVTGVFIKGWYPPGMPCTWALERRDAMRVAAHLGIQFKTLDASAEYKRSVIEYLLAEYQAGRTPNPDVMCNRDVKFGVFYRYAMAEGADAIATGHYLSGEKDQRYFLWAVPREILEKTVFPVGHKDKSEVRTLAKRFRLPVADKKDSQGVCFLGPISVEEFLQHECGTRPGDAFDGEGRRIGLHQGAMLYTPGERVALTETSIPGPWFVQSKDLKTNTIIMAPTHAPESTSAAEIRFREAQWHADPSKATIAQTRYRGPHISGRIEGDRFISKAPLAEYAVPGQSIVFYSGDELIGGGIIA